MEGIETIGIWGEKGDLFHLMYRGSTEIDRHYSKPMLPWIISEIKNQQKSIEVTAEIDRGYVSLRETATGVVILNHTVKQIHKCVMEQADHTCFLYTLRAADKEQGAVVGAPGYMAASDPTVPIPANFIADQNYQCVLLQAASEEQVRKYFACLRQQPREAVQLHESSSMNSLNSLPDLFVHNESQFFEVLFVGRVKVSHSKVPPTFIDEALGAFRQREKIRLRHASGEGRAPISGAAMSYLQEGSSYSVPNIILTSTDIECRSRSSSRGNRAAITYQEEGRGLSVSNANLTSQHSDPDLDNRSRSNSRDLGKANLSDVAKSDQENQEPQKPSKVRFSLWSGNDNPPETSRKSFSMSPPPANVPPTVEMVTYSRSSSVSEDDRDQTTEKSKNGNEDELPVIEPYRQRLRTISGDSSQLFQRPSQNQEQGMRARAGSIGSMTSRGRGFRQSDCDLRMLGQDFNRTMLFHIGRSEIQLINPELKSVQLNKHFKDIAHCCQGLKNNDHFGFICREVSGETPCYLGYVFKCQMNSVTDEIMQALSKAFAAVHEAQVKEKQDNLLCDQCPMNWFSELCGELEGLPAAKAHVSIMKQLSTLPEEDRQILIAKYEGAETSDVQTQNNILMMLLRAHFECKQSVHSHTALPGGGVKPDYQIGTNLESSFRRAKKTLTTSFHQLLKREGRESESSEREVVPEEEQPASIPGLVSSNTAVEKSHINPMPSHNKVHMEGLSDSPLGHRPRSSTVSSAGGDAMRREFLAKRTAAKQLMMDEKSAAQQTSSLSTKRNIFMKVGSPTSRASVDEEVSSEGKNKSTTSFRHAILQRVISPNKSPESLNQLGIRGNQDATDKTMTRKRSTAQLMIIWKKAIFQNILLIRMEKENQRLRALQHEVAIQRVCLNYEEEEVPLEALKAWHLMLSKPNARIDSNILHSGVKQGVPKAVRGEVWQLLKGHQAARNPKLLPNTPAYTMPYEDMLKDLTSQHHAILIDLGRTFPTHPYFMQTLGPGQLSLFNVLKAYSLLDKDVGYCQGLGFVGGVLLLHVEEEVAYNLLKHLMFVMNCRRQYRPDPIGLQVQMYQLSRLLHDQLRNLCDHLENHEVIPQLFATPWFLTLFASQFPLSFVARVFDLLFLEGMETIFRVALILLRTHEEALLACDSFEQIMDYMKTTMPNVHLDQLSQIISQACECSLSRELYAYEVEYHVLQEELALSPQNDSDIRKLKEANKNLKRQNLDLLEQLHQSNTQQHALETSNQSLQQSQHHLEVRVRWLELERNNLKQLVNHLTENLSLKDLAHIPANYQRFLPTDTIKHEKKESNLQKAQHVEREEKNKSSRQKTAQIEKDEFEEIDITSSLPTRDSLHPQHPTSKSVSMGYGMMQRYIKNLDLE